MFNFKAYLVYFKIPNSKLYFSFASKYLIFLSGLESKIFISSTSCSKRKGGKKICLKNICPRFSAFLQHSIIDMKIPNNWCLWHIHRNWFFGNSHCTLESVYNFSTYDRTLLSKPFLGHAQDLAATSELDISVKQLTFENKS